MNDLLENPIRRGAYWGACKWCMEKGDDLKEGPSPLKTGEGVRFEAAVSVGLAAEVGCEVIRVSECWYYIYAYTSGGGASPGLNVKFEIFGVEGSALPEDYAGNTYSSSGQLGGLMGGSGTGSAPVGGRGPGNPEAPSTLGGGAYVGTPGGGVVWSEYRYCGKKCIEPTPPYRGPR